MNPPLTEAERGELNRLRAEYQVCSAALDEIFEPGLTRLFRRLQAKPMGGRHRILCSRIVAALIILCALLLAVVCGASRLRTGLTVSVSNEPLSRAAIRRSGEPEAGSGAIGINTAEAEELTALPGIGPVLAERIVAERRLNGPFHYPADLLRVSGIGPKSLERILPLIHFDTSDP